MSFREKAIEETKAIVLTTLYFAIWFGAMMVFKELILDEYEIHFRGLSAALIGAVVVAKVVLILEHVSLGEWIRKHPAIVDVISRTILYGIGVFVVMLLEKAFESRHESGGFILALKNVFHHRDIYHVWANSICVIFALLMFNGFSIVKRHVGDAQMRRLFFSRPPHDVQSNRQSQPQE